MTRPCKKRRVCVSPGVTVYKPAGIPGRSLEWVTLALDEYEAVRLLDHEGLDQQAAAEAMGVSRPTVTRIYAEARKTIAAMLVLGNALRIEGGPIVHDPAATPCKRRQRGPGHGSACRRTRNRAQQKCQAATEGLQDD